MSAASGASQELQCKWNPGEARGAMVGPIFGERFTTVKDRRKKTGTGLLAAVLRQPGLRREDLE